MSTKPNPSPLRAVVNLRCQIERITYYNPDNNYAVLRAKMAGMLDLITVVGKVIEPIPGAVLSATGFWSFHHQFGKQFTLQSCSCAAPSSVVGIEKYLGSGLIKGIGPKMAKRIVARFQEKTLDIIETDAEQLLQIEGIGRQRVRRIAAAWEEQKEVRAVMIFLQTHQVSVAFAAKIYKRYGNAAIELVREDPYRLAYDIRGIGFASADRIANQLGFSDQSPQRAAAGLMFLLHQAAEQDGHLFVSRPELIDQMQKLLKIEDPSLINEAITNLAQRELIVVEKLTSDTLSTDSIEAIYLAGYHLAETRIVQLLRQIMRSPRAACWLGDDQRIAWVQKRLQIQLAPQQREAVRSSATNKITIITGGPGTGKTTITKAILTLASQQTKKIILAAPTGRAAKRMEEATGYPAKTIHRLLGMNITANGNNFLFNENNPLDCDLLIIDEASMIDLLLAYHLLKAVPKTAVLIWIGDIHQLPSVGAGSLLKDLIASQAFAVTELNQIFRQAQTSDIILNAHRIINGEFPLIKKRQTDFYFITENDNDRLLNKLVTVVTERLPQHFHFDPLADVQVLTPMNRGTVGTSHLNELLQAALNPNKTAVKWRDGCLKVGDKVMQLKNNYNKNVFNGDIGIITKIDQEEQQLQIEMEGVTVNYDYSELNQLTLAYAISIHKSQGSEYPAVVMPLSMAHYVMLQRNLIYTGITRGKKIVVLIGSKQALYLAIQNNQVSQRHTWLAHRC